MHRAIEALEVASILVDWTHLMLANRAMSYWGMSPWFCHAYYLPLRQSWERVDARPCSHRDRAGRLQIESSAPLCETFTPQTHKHVPALWRDLRYDQFPRRVVQKRKREVVNTDQPLGI
jgi:hypothetical protein